MVIPDQMTQVRYDTGSSGALEESLFGIIILFGEMKQGGNARGNW